MTKPVLETRLGQILGQIINIKPELTDKKCVNFNSIPFAKCKRFERAEPYGKWEDTLDGTGNTSVTPL